MTNKDNGGQASDRELLEMSAKAAGYEVLTKNTKFEPEIYDGEWRSWNPLTDDGDALRLAVELGIDIEFYRDSGAVEARTFGKIDDAIEAVSVGGDMQGATRRAIVRAAAAIGSAM